MRTSLILPTYNESANITEVVHQLSSIVPDWEIIIVDDNSPDGTGDIVDGLAKEFGLRIIHREGRLGLSSAIAEGIKSSTGDYIAVMDADLSHPPAIIKKLSDRIIKTDSDIAIGSRYMSGGTVDDWSWNRKLASRVATLLSKKFTKVTDPMSGLFILKKSIVDEMDINSKGYKILLEVLAKTKDLKIVEIPYSFRSRIYGTSKLGLKEYFHFISDWIRLFGQEKR